MLPRWTTKVITISSTGEKNLSNTRYILKNLLCTVIDGFQGFQVPPAELESVLLTHPDIADAAVIGVYNASEATELPRAYVVHAQPNSITSEAQKAAFASSIQRWIQSKVARQKFLRGGTAGICFSFDWSTDTFYLQVWSLSMPFLKG
jgi:hypothetical protein